ncbi:MAG: mechanosensitive ion channel protein MscS, partial [Nitrosopumilus sp.]|nr:mechanosensitive ion channel protein MscS [Nitrosopumilus sp.]
MVEENTDALELGQFERVTELLSSSYEMQMAFIALVIGLSVLFIVYRKFSNWIGSKRISYTRPHLSIFVKTVLLPVFAIVLVSSISAYVQFFVLASDMISSDAVSITK